jgi:deazaflavin-dependent oxidoreductase (nitroreductase family)
MTSGMFAATRAISDADPDMAKAYRRGRGTRAINWWFQTLTRLGLGASHRHILTVPGRRTGQLHSTPVDVIEASGHRWLVAGYGPANWVLNARASGEVTLSRGSHAERYKVAEAGAEEAVPVLRKYIGEIRVTRPYFDATPSSSDAAVAAELGRHAVFRLTPSQ